MSRCNRVEDSISGSDSLVIRRLGKEDVAEVIDLLSDIQEFSRTYKKDEREEQIRRMAEEMTRGSKTVMGGFLDGRLIATASTSAENSKSAMVVGVATDIDFRGKGYASAVVSALCRDCFERGKKYLCLFYDNPVAGRIYNRIGFRELGQYGMLR
ncbi:MAG: GNAT family N-acetyltransferase [Acetatifactor sp.]|nr:GNAT family N-acetyltransferase [Acetatifactor sp.]